MSGLRGPEPVVRSVIARLEERLEEQLAAEWGKWADDIPAMQARRIVAYAPDTEGEYPLIMVLPGRARANRNTGRWIETEGTVTVVVEVRADQADHLGWMLLRYTNAVVAALTDTAAPPPTHQLEWSETEPGPLFRLGDSSAQWQSWMTLTFRYRMIEEDV